MSTPPRDLLGKYKIVRELGKGAMGIVYEGFDTAIERIVAIKTIRKDELDPAEAEEHSRRFLVEAKAAGKLNHLNIVGVYDYGEEQNLAYIVMEYVQGKELKAHLDVGHSFSMREVGHMMAELLDALAYSHEHGVVHRDIKPANIFVTLDGTVKLGDFGIARIDSTHKTHAGTVLGTPSYMSPEQIKGESVDHRTDIYSAGVILYQFLTGQKPFSGSIVTVMHKVLCEEPAPATQLNSLVTPQMERVVAKAMAKDRNARYENARLFASALHSALNEEDSEATRVLRVTDIWNSPTVSQDTTNSGRIRAVYIWEAEIEVEFWHSIKDSTDPDELRLYLNKYPGGQYVDLARDKLSSLKGIEAGKAEEEARCKAEEEAARKAEEARRQTEAEAKRQAEEEAKRQAEEEAKRQAEEEAKRQAEEEAKRQAEEEAKRQAEEEAKRKAEEEAHKAEEEARQKAAEEEARRKAEEEAANLRVAEEKVRRKAEEESRRKTIEEEQAKLKSEAAALATFQHISSTEATPIVSVPSDVVTAIVDNPATVAVTMQQPVVSHSLSHVISDSEPITTRKRVPVVPVAAAGVLVAGVIGWLIFGGQSEEKGIAPTVPSIPAAGPVQKLAPAAPQFEQANKASEATELSKQNADEQLRKAGDAREVAAEAERSRLRESARVAEGNARGAEAARLKAEAEARRMAAESEALRKAEEARLKAEAGAKRLAADAQARQRAADEQAHKAEAESRRIAAEAQARQKAAEDEARKTEEARRQAEADAKQKAAIKVEDKKKENARSASPILVPSF